MIEPGQRSKNRYRGIVTVLLGFLAMGTAGCSTGLDYSSRFSQTVDAIRARFNPFQPEFLRFKTSTDLGYRALALKDYDKAAWHLEFETKNKPNDPAARLYLGQVYAETGRPAQAKAMYQSAITLGSTATVTRDAAALGRPIAEIAAERLAALSGSAETESAPAASITTAALDVKMPMVTVPMPAPPSREPSPPSRKIVAEPDDEPETIVISAATVPRSPAAIQADKPAPSPEPAIAIHLASYKRRAKANAGWDILRRRNPELDALDPTIVEANLGPVKGIYYRLVANGIRSAEDARDICRILKSRGHDWCQIGTVSQ